MGVLVSGGGSNFEALTAAAQNGSIPDASVAVVVSSRPGVGALERAKRLGVEALVLDSRPAADRAAYFARIADEFKKRRVDVVCLAGFLLKLEAPLLKSFPGRILNIHPALLPKFGGKGMWGHHVHEAVLAAGEKESGCTVHVVDEEYDRGPALAQARVPVLPGDTADALAARVLEQEHRLYPRAVKEFLKTLSVRKEPS